MKIYGGIKITWRLSVVGLVCGLLLLGCLPKKGRGMVTAELASPEEVRLEPQEESPIFSPSNGTGDVEEKEPPPVENPVVEEKPVVMEEPQEITYRPDPQELMDTALDHCRTAQREWKAGKLDEALADLDTAYELMLQLDAEENPDFFQEKEDLRYLISKRIVEIHASRRTAIGNNNSSIPIVINDHVKREIRSFQTREKGFFLRSYARSGRWRPMILEALRREGLPEQLSWLPLIESGFKTNALSRARALGLWQFISSTGYRYGLTRDQWVDERMDPVKATDGAIKYLIDLHNLFGDWMSALAAYNCGEGRVLRAIKSQRINYLDNFWDLYEKLPSETVRYVPRFLATLLILEDPEKYGIELPPLNPPINFELVSISRSVRLSDLDGLAGVPAKTFKGLNPELRYGVTPNKAYTLKVPAGMGAGIGEGIASLPMWEIPADSYVIHRVHSGETISTIARKYRTSMHRIVTANQLRNRHRIWPGQKLKIPGRGSPAASVPKNARTHSVTRGDSLWLIAKKYGTTVEKLKDWNQLNTSMLSLGQVLVVRPPKTTTVANTAAAETSKAGIRTYRVMKGDTLDRIARKHGVSLKALLDANNLGKRDKIFPRQTLVVPH